MFFYVLTFLIVLQATLLGDLSGQELKTIVSTTELQKTKGTVRTHYAIPERTALCEVSKYK